jgi:prepilin peptidase CpaA
MTHSSTLQIILLIALCVLAVMAMIADLRSYRIPNRISLAVAAGYPIFVLAGGADWRNGLMAGALVFAVGVFFFARGWMGGGDVKLLAALSLWAGTDLLLPMLLIVTIAGGVMSAAEWFRAGGAIRFLSRFLPQFGIGSLRAVREQAVVPYAAAIFAGAVYVAVSRLIILPPILEMIR